jgi:hypothetical protein
MLQNHQLSGATSILLIQLATLLLPSQRQIAHQTILQGSTGADAPALLLHSVVQQVLEGVHFFFTSVPFETGGTPRQFFGPFEDFLVKKV